MGKTRGMLYLAVTADRLELPMAVAGSVSELAQMIGTSPKVISVAASREHSGTNYRATTCWKDIG